MCDWLPKEIQEIVKQHVWLANPMSSPICRDTDMVRKYEDHERKLRACGHDTQELATAIERARVAIRELDRVNEFMYEQFKRDPFPFIRHFGLNGRDLEGAEPVLSVEDALTARLSKIKEENTQRIIEMRQFNAVETPAETGAEPIVSVNADSFIAKLREVKENGFEMKMNISGLNETSLKELESMGFTVDGAKRVSYEQARGEENGFFLEPSEWQELFARKPDQYELAMAQYADTGSMDGLNALLHDELEGASPS